MPGLHFDGIDDEIEILDAAALNPDRQLTMMGWFQLDEFHTGYQKIFFKGSLPDNSLPSFSNREYMIEVWDTGALHFSSTPVNRVGVGQRAITSPDRRVVPGQWHHVAGVVNADTETMSLYLDGVLQVEGYYDPDGISHQGGDLQFAFDGGFRGSLNEFQLYDRALSAQDIRAQMHTPLDTGNLPSGLRGYWPLDETGGTIVEDLSGNGNNGVLFQSDVPQAVAGALPLDPDTAYQFTRNGSGGAIELDLPEINTTPGEFNTVSFWMNWDGTNSVMPFGMTAYDIWMVSGAMGFNTGQSNLFGISSSGLANRWVHVTAAFHNGSTSLNKIWIDGVPQTMSQIFGSAGSGTAKAQARISGWNNDNGYRFSGGLDEFAIFNRQLSDSEVLDQFNSRNSDYATTVLASLPLAYYRLGEAGSAIVVDSSGNNNDGRAFNPRNSATPAPLFAEPATANLTVTNTADSGPGSLRQAVHDALATPGSFPVNIEFNIPAANLHGPNGAQAAVIRLLTPLPDITRGNINIDGGTQTSFAGDTNLLGPEIVVDGGLIQSSFAPGNNGFDLRSDGNRIAGINLRGFNGRGIFLYGSSDNVVEGMYIGTDETGSIAMGNAWSGIQIAGKSMRNRIGSNGDGVNDLAEGNLISGNGYNGIEINDAGSDYNVIAGNFIGTDASGSYALQNGLDGVRITNGAQLNRIGTDGSDDEFNAAERNLISGNNNRGIRIENAHYNIVGR